MGSAWTKASASRVCSIPAGVNRPPTAKRRTSARDLIRHYGAVNVLDRALTPVTAPCTSPYMRTRCVQVAAVTAAILAIGCLFGMMNPAARNTSLVGTLAAQGRPSPIQTAGGGKGPGAAPDANDPANANADLSPRPPVRPLAPDEQAKQFWLPAGYRMEPVLSDPLIDSPGQVTFDGNGRMFVVELRGYVQTPDGIDTLVPTGRDLRSRGSRR